MTMMRWHPPKRKPLVPEVVPDDIARMAEQYIVAYQEGRRLTALTMPRTMGKMTVARIVEAHIRSFDERA